MYFKHSRSLRSANPFRHSAFFSDTGLWCRRARKSRNYSKKSGPPFNFFCKLVSSLLTPNLFIFRCSIHRVKNCCGSSLQSLYCWSCTLLQEEVCQSSDMPHQEKYAAPIITALRATRKYSQPLCMGSVQYYAALNIYFQQMGSITLSLLWTHIHTKKKYGIQ